jgi:hypothetical protein
LFVGAWDLARFFSGLRVDLYVPQEAGHRGFGGRIGLAKYCDRGQESDENERKDLVHM